MARAWTTLATAAAVTTGGCFALDWDYRDAPPSVAAGGGGTAGSAGAGPCAGAGEACATGLPGACAAGTLVCAGDALECQPDVAPGSLAEACNAADDDCDGSVDEPESSGTPVCPCDVEVFGGHTYLFCTPARTWAEAKDFCYSVNYHLLTINTAQENDALLALGTRLPWGDSWIGYTDAAQDGVWLWEDGTRPGFENWSPNEPNGTVNESCAEMVILDGRWNDNVCDISRLFICEAGAP